MDTKPYELYISLDQIKSLWKCETNWQNELPLRAGFVAIELSFLLVHETTQDPRSTLCREERINRLFSGCRQQVELLQEVLITNFEYGKCAGNLISSLEPTELGKTIDEIAEVPHHLISSQISQYIKAICEHDIDAWLALFEPDASIEDPYGSRAFRSHSGLKVFFRGFIKIFASDIELKDKRMLIFPELGKAEFDWEIHTTHKTIPITFAGTEKIQFAQNGKIRNVQVFHDPSVISQQLLVHHGVVSPKFVLDKISI